MKLPVVRKLAVCHVGSRPSRSRRKRREVSYEGSGLSVSEHPVEWRRIARLGSGATWSLRRADGADGRFVDMLALRPELRRKLVIESGYAKPSPVFEVSYFDEELDDTVVETFHSEKEAVAERDEMQEAGMDPELLVTLGWLPTDRLLSEWSKHFGVPLPDVLVEEMALLFYLERTTDLDGAWWDEDLDPSVLSAPRGVIFQRAVPAWIVKKTARCP